MELRRETVILVGKAELNVSNVDIELDKIATYSQVTPIVL
jgi:hypothetical protein